MPIIRQLLAIREEIGNILTRGIFYSNRSRQRFNKLTLAIFETPMDDKCNPTYLARRISSFGNMFNTNFLNILYLTNVQACTL